MSYREYQHVLQGVSTCLTGSINMSYREYQHVLQGVSTCLTGSMPLLTPNKFQGWRRMARQ